MKKRVCRIWSVLSVLLTVVIAELTMTELIMPGSVMTGGTVAVYAADAENIKKNRVFQTSSDADLHEEPDSASAIIDTLPGGTPVIVREDAKDGWCMVSYQDTVGYVEVSFLGILGSQIVPSASQDQNVAGNEVVPDDEAVQGNEAQRADGAAQDDGIQPADEVQPADGAAQGNETQQEDMAAQGRKTGLTDVNALDEEFKNVQEENLLAYQEAETAKEQARSDRIWGIVIAVLVIAIFAVGIVTTLAGNKGKKKER